MRELAAYLIRPVQEGYPTEYLLARVRGRRAGIVTDRLAPPGPLAVRAALQGRGAAPGVTAAQAREKMGREFRWAYLQMNQGVRETFAPFFLWFELRTVLVFLRLRRGGGLEQALHLLDATLLAERVRRVLRAEEEPFTGRDALSELLDETDGPGRELSALYREGKGGAFELRLVVLYLERLTQLPLHPALDEFFRGLVDLLNLLSLAKQLRWKVAEPRALIRGGTIPVAALEKALQGKSGAGVAALLRRLQGADGVPARPENLEHLLLERLTRLVRKRGRDPLDLGNLLAYLWERYLEARNAGLVHHVASLGDETLGAELIA